MVTTLSETVSNDEYSIFVICVKAIAPKPKASKKVYIQTFYYKQF